MTNIVRNVRSTLNFFLAMLELFISVVLATKVFQADVSSENGLVGYIVDSFNLINDGAAGLFESVEMTQQIAFLMTILVFMVFSQALFLAAPGIIERDRQNSARANRRQYVIYTKKRFKKSRFFIRRYR